MIWMTLLKTLRLLEEAISVLKWLKRSVNLVKMCASLN